MDGRVGGPHSTSGLFEKRDNLLNCRKSSPRFFGPKATGDVPVLQPPLVTVKYASMETQKCEGSRTDGA